MTHFCPSHPCPICNYVPPRTPCPWWTYPYPDAWGVTYTPPPQAFTPISNGRTDKLEELRKEVEKLLESSLFLAGSGRIKKLIRELKTP